MARGGHKNMWKGTVVSIQLAAGASASMVTAKNVRAVAGKGLEEDRYFKQIGSYSRKPGPDREVTLIEVEAIESLKREYGVEIKPEDSRRNIATRGVPLNHLVGRDFRVGEVTLHGIRLCEPCAHMAEMTDKGVLRGLVHRGGLRAQILKSGMIRVGDTVEEG